MPKYVDDVIDIVEDDVEKIRVAPGMYISYLGKAGALHLAREGVNNAIDEVVSDKSPGTKVEVELDDNIKQFTVTDNGRGIVIDKIEAMATTLQSGSNLHKEDADPENVVRKAGEHGVGLTAINAFSKRLTIISYQMTIMKKGVFVFEDGKLKSKKITSYSDKSKHGSTFSFIIDEKYMKTDHISHDDLYEWLNDISYLLPEGVKLTYTHIKKGKDVGTTEKLHHKNGIADRLDEIAPSLLMKPVRITKTFNKGDFIDFIFSYAKDDYSDFNLHDSYCNYIHTIDDGEHFKGTTNGLCSAIVKIVNDSLTDTEKKKLNITYEDVRQGMCGVLNLLCLYPLFTGQTKQKVGNSLLYKPIFKLISDEIREYYKNNVLERKKLVAIVKANAKSRLDMRKVKKSEFKAMDSFEEAKIKGFSPCLVKDPELSELIVTEGGSAGGGVSQICDRRYQAVFELRGNPKNVYGCTVQSIMQNDECKNFCRITGGGMRDNFGNAYHFDINKFRYGKVIAFVDSDIDAHNMLSILSATMLWCYPEVVEQGRFYRTQAPLYLINDKKHPYLTSKTEYYKLYTDKFIKNIQLIDDLGHRLTIAEMRDLVNRNTMYLDEIKSLQKYFYVDSEIFEFLIAHQHDRGIIGKYMKKFPESDYDKGIRLLSTVFKGSRMTITINDNFFDKCKRLSHMINDDNQNRIYYKVIDKGIPLEGIYSLGSIFKLSEKYLPDVIERIKGVGELPPDVIWETVLNPQTRQLIRLTTDDIKRELETVHVLHGPDPSLRKDFMKGYQFTKDILDT